MFLYAFFFGYIYKNASDCGKRNKHKCNEVQFVLDILAVPYVVYDRHNCDNFLLKLKMCGYCQMEFDILFSMFSNRISFDPNNKYNTIVLSFFYHQMLFSTLQFDANEWLNIILMG